MIQNLDWAETLIHVVDEDEEDIVLETVTYLYLFFFFRTGTCSFSSFICLFYLTNMQTKSMACQLKFCNCFISKNTKMIS